MSDEHTAGLPPLPANISHVTRRIRACESEVPAQVVLEHALHAYALAAIACQGDAWQPIETAPRDGTHILGFMQGRVCESFVTPRDDCEMWTFGMWSSSDGRAKPTHWKRLPAPPATTAKDAKL